MATDRGTISKFNTNLNLMLRIWATIMQQDRSVRTELIAQNTIMLQMDILFHNNVTTKYLQSHNNLIKYAQINPPHTKIPFDTLVRLGLLV